MPLSSASDPPLPCPLQTQNQAFALLPEELKQVDNFASTAVSAPSYHASTNVSILGGKAKRVRGPLTRHAPPRQFLAVALRLPSESASSPADAADGTCRAPFLLLR